MSKANKTEAQRINIDASAKCLPGQILVLRVGPRVRIIRAQKLTHLLPQPKAKFAGSIVHFESNFPCSSRKRSGLNSSGSG